MTLSELSALLPETFQDYLAPERADPQRLAPWLAAARSMQIGDLERVRKSLRLVEGYSFAKPLHWRLRRRVGKLLSVNRTALQVVSASSMIAPFVALSTPLDDLAALSHEHHGVLESQLPPLLFLHGLEASYLVSLRRHSDALAQIEDMFRTSARLLASSVPGIANHEGLYRLHHAYVAAMELGNAASNSEDAMLTNLIRQVEASGVPGIDYVRTQLLQFCVNVCYAVWNCPDATAVSEVLRYLHDSAHLRVVLSPVGGALGEWCSSAIDRAPEDGREESDSIGERVRVVANRVLEGHNFPFDKSATLAELRDALTTPWSQLDRTPSTVRELCAAMIGSDFCPGVHNAFATVIVGGRYTAPEAWHELEGNQPTAKQVLLDVPNAIGKALVFEVRRVFFQHLALTMDCWYYLRLIHEVTRCLLGIKAFAVRMARLPTRISELIETGTLRTVPEDPYSRTALEYSPELRLIRVNPSSDEIQQWAIDDPRERNFTWRLLRWGRR